MAKQKYIKNEHYFDVIDTEEKAYFLGFLYADGYNNINRHEIKIRLSIQDEEILLKFRDLIYINKDMPLYYLERNGHKYCELYICNKKLSESLDKNGCGQNKTFNISFPYFINKELYCHFIRGVFDGDGSICCSMLKTGEHKTMFSIIGYRPFMKEINYILSKSCGLNENKLIDYKGKDERIATVAFSGCRQCIKIREYLYKDATIYLQRKYDKFFKLGTVEWRTYDNIKINQYENTIKLTDDFNDPSLHNHTEKLECTHCKKVLTNQNKKYDINKKIYCHKCYSELFYESKKVKENVIEMLNDKVSILRIKDIEVVFDTEDIDIVNRYKWHIENGRVISRILHPKKCIYLNRTIMNAKDGESIAFIDGNKFNLCKINLERRNHR